MANAKYNKYDDIDFSMFEPRQTSYEKNAARKIETIPPFTEEPKQKPRMELVKKPKKTLYQAKKEMQRTALQTAKIIVVSVFLLSMLAALLFSRIKVDELDRQISDAQTKITSAQSENVRLNMKLDSMISLEKVESYAQTNLGMVKMENHQIEYIDLSGSDKVVLSGNKSMDKGNESFTSKVLEYIKK